MSYDCFISYASEDMDALVHPLFRELELRGWTVWFDGISLRAGEDSWRAISQGLAESDLVVLVISPAFLEKSWPQRELAAAVAREAAQTRRLVVPVLHGVTHAQLSEYAPILAQRVSIDASDGVASVVEQLQRVREHSLDDLDEGQLAHLLGPDGRPLGTEDPVRQAMSSRPGASRNWLRRSMPGQALRLSSRPPLGMAGPTCTPCVVTTWEAR